MQEYGPEEFLPKRQLQGQKGLVSKSVNLGLIPGTHMVGESCPLCKINKYNLEACLTEESTPARSRDEDSRKLRKLRSWS